MIAWKLVMRGFLIVSILCRVASLFVSCPLLSYQLAVLLGVMGFKEYMDRQGKFITQAEADLRVAQMQHTRQVLLQRLEYERQQEAARKAQIAAAHKEDAAAQAAAVASSKKKVATTP